MKEIKDITTKDVVDWSHGTFHSHALSWLKEILTGEYPLENARKDILEYISEEEEINHDRD